MAGDLPSIVTSTDVVVIGGGQAALALGFYLRRTGLRYVLLDSQDAPGGAWRRTWPSLRLFSPARWSSLPGFLMSSSADEYPSRDAAIAYLTEYETRYGLPVARSTTVQSVSRDGDALVVHASTPTGTRAWRARAVVSATGTWANPVLPTLPGQSEFRGLQRHSALYDGPASFAGMRVVVGGGGNSGAQIVAELSEVANVTWATLRPPVFLPDDIDGRYLFEQATKRYQAIREGRVPEPPRSLGDIVAVPSVREARERGALVAQPMFSRFTPEGVVWPSGASSAVDAVIWATGFRPALEHLAPLGVVDVNGRVALSGTRAVAEPRLWLVGYGEWTGFASATLIGVGRTARSTVDEIAAALGGQST